MCIKLSRLEFESRTVVELTLFSTRRVCILLFGSVAPPTAPLSLSLIASSDGAFSRARGPPFGLWCFQ